ncbi:MAG TPA: STAS domain-containing protein [Actinocrinis sp.]|nr:STAS domain-containing protein [Actinocrinis sp.]
MQHFATASPPPNTTPHRPGPALCSGCLTGTRNANDLPCLRCPLSCTGPASANAPEAPAPNQWLNILVQHRDSHALAHLTGELDLATACDLYAVLSSLLIQTGRLVIDTTNLTFIDASGLNVLLRAAQQAAATGGWIRLAGARPQL